MGEGIINRVDLISISICKNIEENCIQMMTIGGTAHILMVLASIILIVALMIIVSKVGYKVQCIIIHSCVLLCMLGITFLHLTHYGKTLDFKNFFNQMFQVCNFNFILLPLCLIKKNELGRQYLFYFSMPCALSTFVSYVSDVENSMWYSVVTLNFWLDHLLIVLIPLLMISARWFKPQKKYVMWSCVCILIYFASCFLANYLLNGCNILGPHNHSYTMEPGEIMILGPLYSLIKIPFVYLLPLLPICAILFYIESVCFEKYNIMDFKELGVKRNKFVKEKFHNYKQGLLKSETQSDDEDLSKNI